MKSTTLLFALFLLSVLFTSYLPSATADEFIFDSDGEPLRNGGAYYIASLPKSGGGGIELTVTGNETCPLTVVQSCNDYSWGLPLTISSPYRIRNIYEGLSLDIGFNSVPRCAPRPSKWTVVNLPEGPAVKLSGYANPVAGSFTFEKASQHHFNSNSSGRRLAYKVLFCARDDGTCGGIGVYVDRNGNRHLVVTENSALEVQFLKVWSSTA